MLTYTYESFMEDCFGDYSKPTLEEFRNESRLTYNAGDVSLADFAGKLDDNDYRKVNFNQWSETLYTAYIVNFEVMMKKWFTAHASVDNIEKYLRYSVEPSKYKIDDGFIIDGRKEITSGRLLRNISYKGIYKETAKINSNEKDTLLGVFDNLINNKFSVSATVTPKVSEFLSCGNYDSLFAMLRGTANRASIFNPYTYSWILNNVFPDGKKLLSPVLSWVTPVIGVANSKYDELVAIDVIPEVVERAEKLHQYSEGMRNTWFGDDGKKGTFYCCPSEKLDERHNFSEKYSEYFDLVFFSPPYYNLEVYSGGEQSHETWKTYEEWLDGYWKPTVELCYKCLKPGSKFSFVIVEDYSELNKKRIPISEDMKRIAEYYFKYDKLIHISWGGFSATKIANEKRKNLLENVHILTKE